MLLYRNSETLLWIAVFLLTYKEHVDRSSFYLDLYMNVILYHTRVWTANSGLMAKDKEAILYSLWLLACSRCCIVVFVSKNGRVSCVTSAIISSRVLKIQSTY